MDASMSVALVTDFFMAIAYCVLVIVISVVNLALTNWLTLIPLLIFAVAYIVSYFMYKEKISDTMTYFCQTAHCGRRKLHFDFGASASPTAQSCG